MITLLAAAALMLTGAPEALIGAPRLPLAARSALSAREAAALERFLDGYNDAARWAAPRPPGAVTFSTGESQPRPEPLGARPEDRALAGLAVPSRRVSRAPSRSARSASSPPAKASSPSMPAPSSATSAWPPSSSAYGGGPRKRLCAPHDERRHHARNRRRARPQPEEYARITAALAAIPTSSNSASSR
jgi:hypothetical protein